MIKFEHKFIIAKLIANLFKSKKNNSILMFHSILNDSNTNSDFYSFGENQFFNLLEFIKNDLRYKICSLTDSVKYKNSISITFDDGRVDNYFHAFPIIKRLNIPATIFIISDKVDNSNDHLTTDQIIEMSNSDLIDFQIHGRSHKPFTKLSKNELINEIYSCKNTIEKITNKKASQISLPHGQYNKSVIDLINDLDISLICNSVNSTFNLNDKFNDKLYPRINVWNLDNIMTINQKLSGKWDIFKNF